MIVYDNYDPLTRMVASHCISISDWNVWAFGFGPVPKEEATDLTDDSKAADHPGKPVHHSDRRPARTPPGRGKLAESH